MKKLFVISMMALTVGIIVNTSHSAQYWARTFGSGAYDSAYDVQQTSDGGYIVAGYTGNQYHYDIWILKLDQSGTASWEKTYGGDAYSYEGGVSIQQTSEGGYIVAGKAFGMGDDIWILKLDQSGTVSWQKTYDFRNEDIVYCIQQTSEGGYIVAGSNYNIASGSYDLWILKLDQNGTVSWQKSYGGSGFENGGFIQQTSEGGYIMAGWTNGSFGTSSDFWILKLDQNGTVSWQKIYGGNSIDDAHSIQQTDDDGDGEKDDGYIVAGRGAFGSSDLWILKLDQNGMVSWQKSYGGSGFDGAESIQQTTDGGYVVAGRTGFLGSAYTDMWILKLDQNGSVSWQKTYGGSDNEWAFSIQQTSDGGYIVAGLTESFGAVGSDMLILKLDSNGDINNCDVIGTSDANVIDTTIAGVNSNAAIVTWSPTIMDSTVTPQDSTAEVSSICYAEDAQISNMYVDDAGAADIAVNKAKGDLFEVVHVISPGYQDLSLDTTVPSDWTFQNVCYMRDDSAGTINYVDLYQKGSYQYDGNGHHVINLGYLTGSNTKEVGLRFKIPNDASAGDVTIGSALMEGEGLIDYLSTTVHIVETAEALIVTNRDNLYETYGDVNQDTTRLLNELFNIANGNEAGEVPAVVYYADWYDDAIKNWDYTSSPLSYLVGWHDPLNSGVVDVLDFLIDGQPPLIEGWAQKLFPSAQDHKYIMIVGGDEIVPFYRWWIGGERYFTDTRYADLVDHVAGVDDWLVGDLEAAVGRIAGASVADMRKLIVKGLSGPQGNDSIVIATTCTGAGGSQCYETKGVKDNFSTHNFAIHNDGGSDNTIEDCAWNRDIFRVAVNQGVKYIAEGSHATHLAFSPANGESCDTGYIDSEYIDNQLENVFVGIGGCNAGVIEQGSYAPISSLAYEFIKKGACGYFGSSGLVSGGCYDAVKNKYYWGVKLFNSFFNGLSNLGSIGDSYLNACKEYDPNNSDGPTWSTNDQKAVTEFNLFGVPWMQANFPSPPPPGGGLLSMSSDSARAYKVSEMRGQKAGSQGAFLAGNFSKNYTFTVTDYTISQEDSFDLVTIPGAEFDCNPFHPFLPKLKATFNLPKDASVNSLQQLAGGTSQSLGQLNIPNCQPSTINDPLPAFTDYTEATGLYPAPNYYSDINYYNDHIEVNIYFFPVQHNVDSKETTLWQEATVQVDYSVTESIFIADFSPSKHEYKTTEAISTTVMVENAGSEDVANLSAVLTVKDLQDHTLNSTQQNLATVPAGGSIETPVTISNGLSTGSYLIILEIKDATNSTLAVSSEYIKVTSEYIAGLAVPEESNSTDDIPFTVTVQNDNPAPITADVAIKIYNEQGEHVVGLSAPSEEVPAGTSAAITTYWSDPGKDGGLYTATALVSAGGKQYVYHFSFTVLCAAGRDADADGICDSEDNCSAKPNGLKLGTCITLGKTVSYCTTPGPNVSECGTNGFCSMDQEDSYPPQGNNCGDTCECEGNFDGDLDVDVDGSDAAAFKASFGRSTFQRPCTNADSCNGDFSCDVDVDGTDAALFKSDFGRSTFNNPCPNCITNPWCVYP